MRHSHANINQETWTAVDQYIDNLLIPPDPAMQKIQERCEAAGLPAISITPSEGKFLMLMVRIVNARHVLEIGTLGAISTVWLARGVSPDGHIITLEADPKHAEVARANLALAGVAGAVDVRLGAALETLPQLASEGHPAFDLVFIDADKENYSAYLDWAIRLSRKGAIIIADNVIRDGAVLDEGDQDTRVIGTRQFNNSLAAEKRVEAAILQTVGRKGHDGMAIMIKTED